MNLRQKIQVILLIILIMFTFASYHEGTGGTAWLQWLSVVSILVFMFFFDLAFTNDSNFIFDPDAENWRRKTVSDEKSRSRPTTVVLPCALLLLQRPLVLPP
jgi:hypothetical protein